MNKKSDKQPDAKRKGEHPLREATDVEGRRAIGSDTTAAPGEERQSDRARTRQDQRPSNGDDLD